jgi:putative CocE/NonD family hydrolase
MSLLSWFYGKRLKLTPPRTTTIRIELDLKIEMDDGVVLLADRYLPTNLDGEKLPTVLMRTPYGRGGRGGDLLARLYAERGYQVLIQSTRGTGGSGGGEFVFARYEHADGLATIEWIKRQGWFSGELAMVGPSYLGFAQWSVAAFAGPELKALVPVTTASDFNHFRYPGGSFILETMLAWSIAMSGGAATGRKFKSPRARRREEAHLERAYNHLPLKEADVRLTGQPTAIFQEAIKYGPDESYWQAVDFSETVKDITAPVNLIGGWYDVFLYWQLQDYRRLRQAGRNPSLVIGPWFHGQRSDLAVTTRETLRWLDVHLKGQTAKLRELPVRLFVMGANEWRDFPEWPPAAQEQTWYLQPEGRLSLERPAGPTEPDCYRYNPADPTPPGGGNSLGKSVGAKDNRPLEARSDVLIYSTPPLQADYEVIGPVSVTLYVRSSLKYTDFFARLCVVKRSGQSINLCEGIISLKPGCAAAVPQADGTLCVQIEIWPTAYRFRRGECIRLQVSSGGHPRFVRNTGSGEPLGEETTLRLADQQIYHDQAHPSAVGLPWLKSNR